MHGCVELLLFRCRELVGSSDLGRVALPPSISSIRSVGPADRAKPFSEEPCRTRAREKVVFFGLVGFSDLGRVRSFRGRVPPFASQASTAALARSDSV